LFPDRHIGEDPIMSSNVPAELRYTKSHEWVRKNPDGTVTIGITDHAQHALGDLVFAETPEAGRAVKAGDACAVVESVKAASDVYAPVTGTILEGNAGLADTPEKINADPYGEGWLWRLKPADGKDVESLLDAGGYERFLAESAE
jgi:glycine cleavage system H protein